ncbi:MAG: hypothetical protein A2061_09190 [Gallionellales bacterium GWA2_59_43]|nr:MAG: hypothetical protein A2061_09190 [Gallionellales bacterium GWA2_59_43]
MRELSVAVTMIVVFILVMTTMLAVIVVILVMRAHWNHCHRGCLSDGSGGVAATHSSASRTTDGSPQDCTVLPADVVTHGSTGSTADCATNDGTAVDGIGINASSKKEGNR